MRLMIKVVNQDYEPVWGPHPQNYNYIFEIP